MCCAVSHQLCDLCGQGLVYGVHRISYGISTNRRLSSLVLANNAMTDVQAASIVNLTHAPLFWKVRLTDLAMLGRGAADEQASAAAGSGRQLHHQEVDHQRPFEVRSTMTQSC